jgi:hypothetical protein
VGTTEACQHAVTCGAPEERRLRRRVCKGHVTPRRVLHSNFGCCIGTTKKSATYKISGAAERRAVPIRELVENKDWQLKKKKPAPHVSVTVTFAVCELEAYP